MKKIIFVVVVIFGAMYFAVHSAEKTAEGLSAAYYGKQQAELKRAGLLP
jgi:hypothetical protein